ncbi:MAG: tetratricopeptide repeat protein [bacterium]
MVKKRLLLFLPALAAALIYLPAINYQFVWDDINLIVHNRETPLSAFSQSFWHGTNEHLGTDPYYRPLTNFSLRLERLIYKHQPRGFHLTNILLHCIVCLLFTLLLFEVTGSRTGSVLAGMVFSLHPMAADCVAYISGRTDLIAGLGTVTAFLGLFLYRQRRHWIYLTLTILGYTAGSYAKESAALLLPVLILWLFLSPDYRQRHKVRLLLITALLSIFSTWLLLRLLILKTLLPMKPPAAILPLLNSSLSSFGQQIVLLFIPFTRRTFISPAGPAGLNIWTVIGIGYLLLLLSGFPLMRNRPLVLTGWFWSVVLLLPVAILLPFGPLGRLLYLPAMGILLALSALIYSPTKKPAGPDAPRLSPTLDRKIAFVTGVGWCVLALPFLRQRLQVWQNEETLFSRMVAEAPNYAPGHYNLGILLISRGDYHQARLHLYRAIELDSTMTVARFNLAALLQKTGDYPAAETLLQRVIREQPNFAPAYANLALLTLNRGDRKGAIELQRRACALAPNDASLYYNLALLFRRLGEPESARQAIIQALKLEPDQPRFRQFLNSLP